MGPFFSYSRAGKSMEVNSGKSQGVKLYPIFSTFPSRSILVERKAHLRGREWVDCWCHLLTSSLKSHGKRRLGSCCPSLSTEIFSRTNTIHLGIFIGRALWADCFSPYMNTIAPRDQFKPITIGENLMNYNFWIVCPKIVKTWILLWNKPQS